MQWTTGPIVTDTAVIGNFGEGIIRGVSIAVGDVVQTGINGYIS